MPVTNITNQSYHTSAAAVGFRKGLATAHGLMPFTFYGFDPERDRVQWSQNDRMPKQCQKLEKFVHDYNGANLKKDKDHWNVGIHWRFFRCCRHGYNILFGPSPMIYQ